MKANRIQQEICDVIRSQASFWKDSNDISSPTHLCDIDEELFSQLLDDVSDDDRYRLGRMLEKLYWFVREFDNKEE